MERKNREIIAAEQEIITHMRRLICGIFLKHTGKVGVVNKELPFSVPTVHFNFKLNGNLQKWGEVYDRESVNYYQNSTFIISYRSHRYKPAYVPSSYHLQLYTPALKRRMNIISLNISTTRGGKCIQNVLLGKRDLIVNQRWLLRDTIMPGKPSSGDLENWNTLLEIARVIPLSPELIE